MDSKDVYDLMIKIDRKFTTFANAAGYEFDEEGNATRVAKPVAVVSAKPKRFNFKQSLIDAGACPDDAQLFMDVRTKKKAVNTEQAYNRFIGTLGGYTVAQAVEIAAGEQWKGFKVDWVNNMRPEQKKRYSFMELARGDHLRSINGGNNLIDKNSIVMDEFAALESGFRQKNLT